MAEQDFDQSEEATPYKLEQARKRGTVAKSPDFTAVAVLAAMVGTLYAMGWHAVRQSAKLEQGIFAKANQLRWNADDIGSWLGVLLLDILQILAPLFLAVSVTAVIIIMFQTGPVFSFKPLTPDFSRINPATGFKKIFSIRTIYEAGKGVFKLAILGTVAYMVVRNDVPKLLGLLTLEPRGYTKTLLDLASSMLVKLILTLLVLALIDSAYTRWEFAKRMRMSRRDIRDEHKHREGDPRIRARIRELRKEMLKRSKAMRNLPTADVLITNPTRIAVALRYQHGTASAPQLVAKGAGELARKMRLAASRHHIPVVQNKPLARALFLEVDYEANVPEKFYAQLAKIMVWAYMMREAAQRTVGARSGK